MRVFDMPSARLLDWWRCASPPTSIAVAPDSSMLASTHAGAIGVYLWANRTQYDDIVLRAPGIEPALMALPTLAGAAGESETVRVKRGMRRRRRLRAAAGSGGQRRCASAGQACPTRG